MYSNLLSAAHALFFYDNKRPKCYASLVASSSSRDWDETRSEWRLRSPFFPWKQATVMRAFSQVVVLGTVEGRVATALGQSPTKRIEQVFLYALESADNLSAPSYPLWPPH